MSTTLITLRAIRSYAFIRFGAVEFEGLPKTEAEFAEWWHRVASSPDLVARWKQRVESVAHIQGELAVESLRKAA